MSEITTRHHEPEAQQLTLLNFIASAVRDPSIDVNKLESLVRIQREIAHEQSQQDFNRAMSATQAEMQPIVRNAKNDQTKSRYARLETIDEQIRPIYTKYGFSLSFSTDTPADAANLCVVCEVAHSGGHVKRHSLEATPDLTGAQGKINKTALHGLGSTITYLRRYLTCMIFNVILTDEDDDGNNGRRQDARSAIDDHIDAVGAAGRANGQTKDPWVEVIAGISTALAGARTPQAVDALERYARTQDALRLASGTENERKIRDLFTKRRSEVTPAGHIEWAAAFSYGACDEFGEPVKVDGAGGGHTLLFTEPVVFARWLLRQTERRPTAARALMEHNADAVQAASDFPDALRIIETIVVPAEPGIVEVSKTRALDRSHVESPTIENAELRDEHHIRAEKLAAEFDAVTTEDALAAITKPAETRSWVSKMRDEGRDDIMGPIDAAYSRALERVKQTIPPDGIA